MAQIEIPSQEELEAHEAELVFTAFDENTAIAVGMALVEAGRAIRAPIVIDIRTPNRTLFHAALPGAAPDNDSWVRRKSNFVLRMHCSSMLGGVRFKAKGKTVGPETGLDVTEYAAHGGSVPIRVAGAGVVGAATVSGLSQPEDHQMVVEALRAVLR
ncbi:heme-degrading domain-containing protein [Jiella marina]|uniref:heme-degrading domain-containing protein n=1 Tax=Jiella sp. LLJ827 TaxID=2917712 RepID=UPI002100E3B6|nr:heme-degrading domain-containing protein [Jiella sp. LLJ827]MCQ0987131.1 heme-degrading domain-containing protein [Jiella sp. LLJ827]